jgi:hypothetical protein
VTTFRSRTGRRFIVLAGAVLALAVALALGAAPASADCRGVAHRAPRRIDPGRRPPLAIGDSTMEFAVPGLAAAGFEANARKCRPMFEALDMLRRYRRQHRLANVVLINLGDNGGISTQQILDALRIMGPRRILVMVTPRKGHDANVIRAAGRRFPRRMRVLDWVRYTVGHPRYFDGDGLHLTPEGDRAFVRFCKPVLALNRPVRRSPRP